MAAKRGTRSKRAQGAAGARNLTADAVVVFGILVSVGLIAVSVALNVRMGYRSGDSDFDGKLYGLGAGLGDCLKAIAPFMMSWGIRHGDALAAISAVLLFGICTGYSFVSSLGFAAEQRANKAGVALGSKDSYGDLRGRKTRLEERLAFLGLQRSVAEVDAAIMAVLSRPAWRGGQTVGAVSADCSLNRKATRQSCEEVAKLRAEKARAEEFARVGVDLEAVLQALAARSSVATTVDAQVDALAKVTGLVSTAIAKDTIGLGLSLLLACFLEIGSGLGLYMVTTPWRQRNREGEGETWRPEKQAAVRLGHIGIGRAHV